jgi:hypothetical protein
VIDSCTGSPSFSKTFIRKLLFAKGIDGADDYCPRVETILARLASENGFCVGCSTLRSAE